MKYSELVELASPTGLIDSASLRVLGEDSDSLVVQLSRWVRSGKLIRLRRSQYLLPQCYRKAEPSHEYIANLLVTPSYISLERALSIHGLIPEAVFGVTSVTTRRPVYYETDIARFSYRFVQPAWFFGYEELPLDQGSALVATPEKALLDLIHLSHGEYTMQRIIELRLQNLEVIDIERLSRYATRIGKPRIQRAVENLLVHLESESEGEVLS